jgi:hypothetical protein
MPNPRCVVCVLATIVALLVPAAAFANHEAGGAPPQAPAPSGQEGTAPASPGTQQGNDNTSTLVSVGTMAGLLVLSGALIAVRARRSGSSTAPR